MTWLDGQGEGRFSSSRKAVKVRPGPGITVYSSDRGKALGRGRLSRQGNRPVAARAVYGPAKGCPGPRNRPWDHAY